MYHNQHTSLDNNLYYWLNYTEPIKKSEYHENCLTPSILCLSIPLNICSTHIHTLSLCEPEKKKGFQIGEDKARSHLG